MYLTYISEAINKQKCRIINDKRQTTNIY